MSSYSRCEASDDVYSSEEGSENGGSRGSIAFFSSYRPPVPLDIFCRAVDQNGDELHLTDGESYNYNGQPIVPPEALKAIAGRLDYLGRSRAAVEEDIDSGRLTGLVFVSERDQGLETLHVALRFADEEKAQVFSLAEIFGNGLFGCTRLEDGGCIAGGFDDDNNYYLVYVSTKDPVCKRRNPWNVVYKTNLITGETERLTPRGTSDLSPAVSEDGQYVAVASFQGKEWGGAISNLMTDIYMINLKDPLNDRKLVIKNGGWPSWGGDDFIFFHRKEDNDSDNWGVYRYSMSSGKTVRVTPASFDAVTPAAIDADRVAVATIRQKSTFNDVREPAQYRHIEVYDMGSLDKPVEITRYARPKADHFNPFVLDDGKNIGYHRCKSEHIRPDDDVPRPFHTVMSPYPDVDVFRVSGVFPTFSKDGSKLAFVDNEFRSIWIADCKGLRIVYEASGPDSVFSPVWNQKKDTLYVCMGPSFKADAALEIHAFDNVCTGGRNQKPRPLTVGGFNNAFPYTNPDGTKFVFRSTRDGGKTNYYKNLYIMEDADAGEAGGSTVTRLTTGDWTDTHCQWSPNGDWIVFSSNRDEPLDQRDKKDHGLDSGYFAVFLMDVATKAVVRVIRSGLDISGHVNHPVFSPDGKSIAVTSDLAAVSADPMSLPLFLHSVRPYGDIFVVDIDPKDLEKNKDVDEFTRVTHSRYENSTPTWTAFGTDDPNGRWNVLVVEDDYTPVCPHMHPDGGEGWRMTGQICIPKRPC